MINPVCKLLSDVKLNLFSVMKTWMSHGRVGGVLYAKWVNFEHLYSLNVLAFWSKSHFQTTSAIGKYLWKVLFKSKGWRKLYNRKILC